ncbi:hypothetical protein JTF06_06640 [Desemzia sp. RIT804]|uniref:hypothetical protein n=1 Tax=Desemzia sp. RIT 804 TaxID=2810209 RepID=UPI001951D010|nr:hypothetical protein [Desemzia sp. RIT 804]MBM6614566.1 hypothetical protein [Desemzia sp. RIT 804]
MEYLRDHAMMVAIFGFAGFVWFGWAQENPKKSWRKYLGIGAAISVLIGLYGIYLSINNWNAPSALNELGSLTWYYVIVALEFTLAIIGAYYLTRRGLSDHIASWICFIVGIHFFPLAIIFKDGSLHILGILFLFVIFYSIEKSKTISYASSALIGIGAGSSLLAFALFNLYRVLSV